MLDNRWWSFMERREILAGERWLVKWKHVLYPLPGRHSKFVRGIGVVERSR